MMMMLIIILRPFRATFSGLIFQACVYVRVNLFSEVKLNENFTLQHTETPQHEGKLSSIFFHNGV